MSPVSHLYLMHGFNQRIIDKIWCRKERDTPRWTGLVWYGASIFFRFMKIAWTLLILVLKASNIKVYCRAVRPWSYGKRDLSFEWSPLKNNNNRKWQNKSSNTKLPFEGFSTVGRRLSSKTICTCAKNRHCRLTMAMICISKGNTIIMDNGLSWLARHAKLHVLAGQNHFLRGKICKRLAKLYYKISLCLSPQTKYEKIEAFMYGAFSARCLTAAKLSRKCTF